MGWRRRLATAAVGLPVVGCFVMTETGTLLLLMVVAVLISIEFEGIAKAIIRKVETSPQARANKAATGDLPWLNVSASLALLLWTFWTSHAPTALDTGTQMAAVVVGAIDVAKAVRSSIRHSLEGTLTPPSIADLVRFLLDLCALMLSRGLCYLVLVRRLGLAVILAFIGVVWQTDNGALFLGSLCSPNDFIGQLFPSGLRKGLKVLSPSKSLSGVVGGLLLGTGTSAVLGILRPIYLAESTLPPRGVAAYAVVGLCLSILAVGGDLLESFFKRVAHVKDSGTLLPGHGGILDRMDSILMAVPAFYTLMMMISLDETRQ